MRHKFRRLPVGRTKRRDDAENRLDYEFSQKMLTIQRKHGDCHEEDPDSGVVYVGNIPHGFYEVQMYRYFTQFGRIKRLRMSRSKKSGRSKGYAFIEFEFAEVAKAVADTMNNYLFMRRMLKCEFVPKEKLHAETFRGCFKPFPQPVGRRESIKRNNAYLKADPLKVCKNLRRRAKQEAKKEKLLAEMGVDYKIDAYKREFISIRDKLEKANEVFESLQNWEEDSVDEEEEKDGSSDGETEGEAEVTFKLDDQDLESPPSAMSRRKRKPADTPDVTKTSGKGREITEVQKKQKKAGKSSAKKETLSTPKSELLKSKTAKSTGKKSLAGRKQRSGKSRQSM